MRCSAARRAERGPSPGTFARSWMSFSISGPVTRFAMRCFYPIRRMNGIVGKPMSRESFRPRCCFDAVRSERQLHARRYRQAGGQLLRLLGRPGLRLALGLLMRGEDQLPQYFDVVFLEDRGIDLEAWPFALAVPAAAAEAPAG